jgi:hypothetical protein
MCAERAAAAAVVRQKWHRLAVTWERRASMAATVYPRVGDNRENTTTGRIYDFWCHCKFGCLFKTTVNSRSTPFSLTPSTTYTHNKPSTASISTVQRRYGSQPTIQSTSIENLVQFDPKLRKFIECLSVLHLTPFFICLWKNFSSRISLVCTLVPQSRIYFRLPQERALGKKYKSFSLHHLHNYSHNH